VRKIWNTAVIDVHYAIFPGSPIKLSIRIFCILINSNADLVPELKAGENLGEDNYNILKLYGICGLLDVYGNNQFCAQL
jgi:hypothetical protein